MHLEGEPGLGVEEVEGQHSADGGDDGGHPALRGRRDGDREQVHQDPRYVRLPDSVEGLAEDSSHQQEGGRGQDPAPRSRVFVCGANGGHGRARTVHDVHIDVASLIQHAINEGPLAPRDA